MVTITHGNVCSKALCFALTETVQLHPVLSRKQVSRGIQPLDKDFLV